MDVSTQNLNAPESTEPTELTKSTEPTERKNFSYSWWFYVLAFLAVDTLGVMLLQWSVNNVDPFKGFLVFVGHIFLQARFVFVLNLLILGVIYAAFLFLFNRFWVGTPAFIVVVTLVAVAERMKVMVRHETILPSDLQMAGTNTGNLTEFIPSGSTGLFIKIPIFLFICILLSVLIARTDGKARLLTVRNVGVHIVSRILLVAAPIGFIYAYSANLGTVGSWSYTLSEVLGDAPRLWDSVEDAKGNGTLIGFLRFTNPKVMDAPEDYSKATMTAIARKYSQSAEEINVARPAEMTDSSLIMVLSESFSDPTRAPGVVLNKDPMPNIRSIKENTTSGLMLSSGYGGGTANLEFQALTGLSMANFDPSLSSPYQQLIPQLDWAPTFNQFWNENSGDGSLAFHPYAGSMYSRQSNYKKFGFQKFWTLSGPDVISPQEKIDRSPYVSDASAYQAVLERISDNPDDEKFYQLVTMQNHMGYDNWYDNNEFEVSSAEGYSLGPDETQQITTYSKGISYTDTATRDFLDKLDAIDKPITAIFYGDHLPGIYASAGQDPANSVALHETDYFIWSNKASNSHGHQLSMQTAAYTSPNFLMAQTAEHMNAKVSGYLAFLTLLHQQIPAMEPPVVNVIQQWKSIPEGESLNLDSAGNQIDPATMSEEQKQLLHDYKLIQYDITTGKQYLKNTDFMELPVAEVDDAGFAADSGAASGEQTAEPAAE